ncbi:MAG: hypothetical protein AAF694_05540 [Bacteroidota bacterium]
MRSLILLGTLLLTFNLVTSLTVVAQSQSTWDVLSRVSFDSPRGINRNYETAKPIFSDAILVLEGEEVTLEGYIYPLESKLATQHFVLSAMPLNACFFCGKAGPETVIEVYSQFLISYTRKKIKLRGTFRLNSDDPMGIMYKLYDAEEVR